MIFNNIYIKIKIIWVILNNKIFLFNLEINKNNFNINLINKMINNFQIKINKIEYLFSKKKIKKWIKDMILIIRNWKIIIFMMTKTNLKILIKNLIKFN